MSLPLQMSNSLSLSPNSSYPAPTEHTMFSPVSNDLELQNSNMELDTEVYTLEQALNSSNPSEIVHCFINELQQNLRFNPTDQYSTAELNTWILIDELITARMNYDIQNSVKIEEPELGPDSSDLGSKKLRLNPRTKESRLVDYLFSTDRELTDLNAIRTWLERIGPNPRDLPENLPGWDTTSAILRNRPDRYITKIQLDIDCAYRDPQTPLTPEAKQRDILLSRAIFEHFRKGNLEGASDVACKYNEPWRAASFNGGEFLSYPSKHDPEGEFRGNYNRVQFKKRCEKLSKYPKFNPYERALYALLSGNLSQLTPVCRSWEDHLWALISCEIDKRVDTYIERRISEHMNLFKRKSFSFLSLTQLLKSSKEYSLDPPHDPNFSFHIIQDYIIKNQFDELFHYAKIAINSGDDSWNNGPLKRFFAHLYIYLSQCGIYCDPTSLISYINELEQVPSRMVALYCAKLPLQDQIIAYSSFLIKLEPNSALRNEFVRYASGYGLSVKDIVVQTAELAIKHAISSLPDLLDESLSIEELPVSYEPMPIKTPDQLLINAISWVVTNPATYLESAMVANQILRIFLLRKKLYPARMLVKSIPNAVEAEWASFLAQDHYPDSLTTAHDGLKAEIREFYGHKQLVNCLKIVWQVRQKLKEQLKPSEPGFVDWESELRELTLKMEHCFVDFVGLGYMSPEHRPMDDISPLDNFGLGFATANQTADALRKLYIPELLLQIHEVFVLTSETLPENPSRGLELLLPLYAADDPDGPFELLGRAGRLDDITRMLQRTSIKMMDLQCAQHRKPATKVPLQKFRIRF